MIDNLLTGATQRYIDGIVIATTAARGLSRPGWANAGPGRHVLMLILLVAVALAPAVSRAHLRVSAHPTPAQENERFRWSNSCEHVPTRLAADNDVVPAPVTAFAMPADSSPPRYSWPEPKVVRDVSLDTAPPGLRAPPSLAL